MQKMNNRIVGNIAEKDVKAGTNKFGKSYNRYLFVVNGLKLSSFDDELAGFNQGDFVDVSYEQNGVYNTIVSMTHADKDMNVPVEKVVASSGPLGSVKDQLIIAQCLTKVWADMSGEVTPQEIYEVYQTFLKLQE